jgi:hypothetical protein
MKMKAPSSSFHHLPMEKNWPSWIKQEDGERTTTTGTLGLWNGRGIHSPLSDKIVGALGLST